MISEQDLRKTLHKLIGQHFPKTANPEKIAAALNNASSIHNVALSAYGYIMWVIEHCGVSAIHKGGLSVQANVDAYASVAKKYKEDMPMHIINASKYVDKVFNTIQDPELCMVRLEGMSFPHVLYVLFAAAGQEEAVMKYRTEIEEHLKRYPGSLDMLPEKFKNVGRDVLNADA